MSHGDDPFRISRRAALGAAAAAGATLGSAGNALAAPTPTDPDDPTENPSSSDRTVFPAIARRQPPRHPIPEPGWHRLQTSIDITTGTRPRRRAQLRSANGYSASVTLPHGARITEMVVYRSGPTRATLAV